MTRSLGAVVLLIAALGAGAGFAAEKPPAVAPQKPVAAAPSTPKTAATHHKAKARSAKAAPAKTAPAGGAPVVALAVRDGLGHRKTLSLTDLRDMPQTEVAVSQVADKGMEEGRYSGVLLWSLIDKQTQAEKGAKNEKLRRTVAVIGRDGYWVALSLGEIDPDYSGAQAMIALKKDGQNLEAPRLVIPGDKHAGRSVREVIALDVR